MKKEILKELQNDLNWSTRIYRFLVPLMAVLLLIFINCEPVKPVMETFDEMNDSIAVEAIKKVPNLSDSVQFVIAIKEAIKIKDYFQFIDQQIMDYDSLVPYPLTEHLLIIANPWVIDSLVATDYYIRMNRGEFVYDQKELVVLQKGDSLVVPVKKWADRLIAQQARISIDINVPEYALRILEDEKEQFRFLVRVGQNRERYLATAGRMENLRTRRGSGTIVKIKRNPIYMNPVDGHRYKTTRRDDGQSTKLPQIPFLHTEINGHRWGQLIHPTTNPETLGKAYSNGCIGTSEADAWRIYYSAPVGTKIVIRYDLDIVDEKGDSLTLKNIYF